MDQRSSIGPDHGKTPIDAATADTRIRRSWHTNANAWTAAVRAGRIASRRRVTDGAILAAIGEPPPATVLDLGCGEGWLARALAARGARVTGIDGEPSLVRAAHAAGGGTFEVLTYEALANGAPAPGRHDAVVCNFSLIGGDVVDALMRRAPDLLRPGGRLIVQTLHPVAACGDQPYRSGWRAGSWAGFDNAFTDPAPWYFRTIGDWVALVQASGLVLTTLQEPLDPDSGQPASLILIASAAG